MKNKKKKRGFTLVELLATITILSVVMIIAIPSVTKLIKKFGDNYYKTLEESIKLAGIDYFTDHKKEIPKYVGETSIITIDNFDTNILNYNLLTEKEEITITVKTNNTAAKVDYPKEQIKLDYGINIIAERGAI